MLSCLYTDIKNKFLKYRLICFKNVYFNVFMKNFLCFNDENGIVNVELPCDSQVPKSNCKQLMLKCNSV